MNITIQRSKKERLCKVCGKACDRNPPAVYCSGCVIVQKEAEKERCRKYRATPHGKSVHDRTNKRKKKDKDLLVYAYSGNEYKTGAKVGG